MVMLMGFKKLKAALRLVYIYLELSFPVDRISFWQFRQIWKNESYKVTTSILALLNLHLHRV